MPEQAVAPDLLKAEHSQSRDADGKGAVTSLPQAESHQQALYGDTHNLILQRPSAPEHSLVPVLSWHSPSLLIPPLLVAGVLGGIVFQCLLFLRWFGFFYRLLNFFVFVRV